MLSVVMGQVAVAAAVPVVMVQAVAVAVERAVTVQAVAVAEPLVPELSSGLLHFEKAGKHLFFAPEIPNWLVVNKNSAVLLLNADGQRSVDEILDSVGLQESLRQDAYVLFKEAQSRGLLKRHQLESFSGCGDSCACSDSKATREGALRSVYLKLTDDCNLRCKYCYAGSGVGKSTDVLSIEVLRRILKEASEISPSVEYVLSGGEPLLHPHALDFAEEAHALGNSVQILTNGALITTDEMAQRIASVTTLVKISLDGSTEEIHSISRGKRNFDLVTKGIDLLIKHGANVQVAMTVTAKNVKDLKNMSDRYGSRLTLQPLFKAGRGKGKANVALSGKEYYEAMDQVENIAPMGNVAAVLESLRGRGVKKCALAEREISISEKGDVYPCQLLHSPEFLAGNIHDDSLRDLYFNKPTLPKLRKINVDTIEECAQCEIRLICGGGCRARDFYESGSIETVGEFCEYEKLAFINGLLDYTSFET